jgi:hypothetical protein
MKGFVILKSINIKKGASLENHFLRTTWLQQMPLAMHCFPCSQKEKKIALKLFIWVS